MGVSESEGSNEMIAQIRYEFMFDFFGRNKNVYNAVCGHFSEIDLSNGAGRDEIAYICTRIWKLKDAWINTELYGEYIVERIDVSQNQFRLFLKKKPVKFHDYKRLERP